MKDKDKKWLRGSKKQQNKNNRKTPYVVYFLKLYPNPTQVFECISAYSFDIFRNI